MQNGIYVLSRDENNKITTEFCESWFKLIQFLDMSKEQEIYCTISFNEWYMKLKEWSKKNA